MVIFAIGQTVELKDLLKDTKVEFFRGVYPVADKLTYQTAEPDIFVGGDVFTGPKFAIDAIAAGKEAAESLHRFVQHGHMTIGRNRRDFASLELMLWGGTIMLIVDHIINGELTWAFPFFTALGQEGGGAVMLREMLTVGVPMSLAITAVWAVYALLKERRSGIAAI
ncbi:MAG: hypothetical protein K6G53_09705 [Bacteroidales bacterium]|nr:hypothetical protein [Bacteroidales bacterium]